MKNILLISELYPIPTKENKSTYVCQFFAREWVKFGYNVVAIHFQPVYCWLWYKAVKYFGDYLRNKLGGLFYDKRLKDTEHYEMEGVQVYRIPIYNHTPHGRYSEKAVNDFVQKACKALEEAGFTPDVITGHMMPIEIIPALNKHYHAKTCAVSHSTSPKILKRYNNYKELMGTYDIWGYRSKAIRQRHEAYFGEAKKSFYCLSGIPGEFIVDANHHDYSRPVKDFVFVGEFIHRKHPDALLSSIPLACGNDYHITFIGQGPEKSNLDTIIASNNQQDKVTFTGKIKRTDIHQYFDKADCMIMISHGEAYGLVYLEAMGRGCITIASRNEGFDGVIIDGENGFLCEAGNEEELGSIIRKINGMPSHERQRIADNGLKTAKTLTDELVAKSYIEELKKL